MSAAVCALVLALSPLCVSTVVSGVGTPTNVRLCSYNMNLVLSWDPPEQAASSLVYTTEYKSSVTDYRVGCVNISSLECDFSRLNISIFEYAKYTGRVRVEPMTDSSAWMESNQLTLDKDTIISYPSVSLLSNGAVIEVSITDPVFRISSLRNVYHLATYNITYWKDGQKDKTRSLSNIQQNRVVLSDLDTWTKYCVQVQIITERNLNPSKPSTAVCESTTTEEKAPWVAAVVTFVVMAMAVAMAVVAVVYRRSISHFLCPKEVLPQHFKEYLLAPLNSSTYLAIRDSHPPEEIFHQVSVITDGGTLEEVHPLEAAESSCSKQPDAT